MNPFFDGQNPFADRPDVEINPYAPPQEPTNMPPQILPIETGFPGLWRQGNVLIMHKDAPLPPICVKNNQPTPHRLTRKLSWVTPWIGLSVLISPLIYIVLAIILTKRATIQIGISKEWLQRRWRRMLIFWCIGLLAVGLMMLGVFFIDGIKNDATYFIVPFASGLVLLLTAIIYGQFDIRMVHASKMTDTHIWIKGVHPEYLNRLPTWTV